MNPTRETPVLAGRQPLEQPVLMLNRSWIPVHVTSAARALVLLFQDAAQVIATDTLMTHAFDDWASRLETPTGHWIRTPSLQIPVPEVILLRRYNKVPSLDAPFTRRNLFQRDDHTCQYCGRREPSSRLSIDHVRPRSKGGKTTWENCVLACLSCNARKGDRTLREVGLDLCRPPRRPRWSPYLTLGPAERLPGWQRFTG